MSKFKITSFLILIIFFLNNCGFTPQYAGFKNLDFNIIVKNSSGDRDLNNAIKSKLNRYQGEKENLKVVNVNFNTVYVKNVVAKNTKGEATKYNLIATVNFKIEIDGSSTNLIFKEQFKIDKIDDTVEENNYIKIVKSNFAESIAEKLIREIQKNR
tara:strand:+ start:177 stop:644 length:468 start_codon:yes stop_codon:yes gene_type:complete